MLPCFGRPSDEAEEEPEPQSQSQLDVHFFSIKTFYYLVFSFYSQILRPKLSLHSNLTNISLNFNLNVYATQCKIKYMAISSILLIISTLNSK